MKTLLDRYLLAQNDIKDYNKKVVQTGTGKLIFDKVLLDLKVKCNLNCWGCFNAHSRNAGSSGLILGQKLDLLNEVIAYGVKILGFAGHGEPLLDPDIWPITEKAREMRLEVVLYTNGTMLNRDFAHRLKEYQVSILIKRNTFDHAKQNMLFRTSKPMSELALKYLENLIDMGFKAPNLALESYVIRPIMEDLKDVLRYCRKHQLVPYFESYLRVSKHEPEDPEWVLSNEELSELFEELRQIDKEEFGIDVELIPGSRVYGLPPCDKAHTAIAVRNNGEVTLCINQYRKIGNVREKPLSEILNPALNPKLKQLFPLRCWYSTAHYIPPSNRANYMNNCRVCGQLKSC